jgi:hypothetical protein
MLAVAELEQLPVAQARVGDPEAWESLYRRYQLPLYVYVFELVQPKDVIDGKPLRYRLEAGRFVLYSVGWNAKDDGGEYPPKTVGNPEALRGTARRAPEGGDWVWRYPAS